jgi:hypothetical protein
MLEKNEAKSSADQSPAISTRNVFMKDNVGDNRRASALAAQRPDALVRPC